MCAGALLESYLLGIGRPFWTRSHPKLPLEAQGVPNSPTASQGSQWDAKVTPKRTPWEPKASQYELQRHPKETSISENYVHLHRVHANCDAKSQSTAIQRSARTMKLFVPPTPTVVPHHTHSIDNICFATTCEVVISYDICVWVQSKL